MRKWAIDLNERFQHNDFHSRIKAKQTRLSVIFRFALIYFQCWALSIILKGKLNTSGFNGWGNQSIHCSLLSLTAKPVRPGHYPVCSPTNPFFIRGFSDQPIAFCNAVFHNRNKAAAAPAAPSSPISASPTSPSTPESEPRLPESNSNQNSPAKHLDFQNNDAHDSNVQNNMWVKRLFWAILVTFCGSYHISPSWL